MDSPQKDARDFFNEISKTYRQKYEGSDVFHRYFFNERLEEATRAFEFRDKLILDIGAGTGNLFDRLLEMEPTIDYYATDVASEMLAASRIPAERRFVGRLDEIVFPVDKFDYIFMLGVTSYLNDIELDRTLNTVHALMGDDGRAVITFTNQNSLDWRSRRTIKSLFRPLLSRKAVLGQPFKIHPQKLGDITKNIETLFRVEEVRLLNHTVFPMNQLFKKLSVEFARRMHKTDPDRAIARLLSSDFMLILRKA